MLIYYLQLQETDNVQAATVLVPKLDRPKTTVQESSAWQAEQAGHQAGSALAQHCIDPAKLSRIEQDILHRLAMGQGILLYEEIGLLERCGGCGRVYMGSALRQHLPLCPAM